MKAINYHNPLAGKLLKLTNAQKDMCIASKGEKMETALKENITFQTAKDLVQWLTYDNSYFFLLLFCRGPGKKKKKSLVIHGSC